MVLSDAIRRCIGSAIRHRSVTRTSQPRMLMSDLLIAVDGGATGTRARIADADGRTLGAGEAGPGSLTLGVDRAWTSVRAAMAQAAHAAGLPNVPNGANCGLALAGSRHPGNRAAFLAGAPPGCRVRLMTDGHASLIGALAGRPGSVVAVGTGTAGHRLFADGTSISVDGWGFPAGDEGSGAWIGLEAARLHLRAVDGRMPATGALAEALADRLGRSAGAIQDALVGAPSTTYATLAPLVIRAADADDPAAIDILRRAGSEIGRTIVALDRDDPAPDVALIGGLAQALAAWLPPSHHDRLIPARGTALDGVLLILTGAAPEEVFR